MTTVAPKPIFDKGLANTIAAESAMSWIDGQNGVLEYVGIDIDSLARNSTFEETVFLLWRRKLPTAGELDAFCATIRGEYALPGESSLPARRRRSWLERLGIDREFTRGDRWVAYVSVAWPLLWATLFLAVTVWNLSTDVPGSWWIRFWRIWVWVFSGGALAVTLWFTVGGLFDLRFLFRHLKSFVPDPSDDGRVHPSPRKPRGE